MNYTELNEDPVDIPGFDGDLIFANDPYAQGMRDYWYGEHNWYRIFEKEKCELYMAGRRNAMLMIETLRNVI